MAVDNVDYFAKNIKYLRLKNGFKQAEICAVLGFVQATWSEYEHGWSKPRFNDLLKIIVYFDVTASELIEMDLSKYDLNEILELRKIVKKYDPKYDNSYDLNHGIVKNDTQDKEAGKAVEPAVLDQLNRIEKELRDLRSKLAQ